MSKQHKLHRRLGFVLSSESGSARGRVPALQLPRGGLHLKATPNVSHMRFQLVL